MEVFYVLLLMGTAMLVANGCIVGNTNLCHSGHPLIPGGRIQPLTEDGEFLDPFWNNQGTKFVFLRPPGRRRTHEGLHGPKGVIRVGVRTDTPCPQEDSFTCPMNNYDVPCEWPDSAIRPLVFSNITSNSVTVSWEILYGDAEQRDPPIGWYELHYRKAGEPNFENVPVSLGYSHELLYLEPDTIYELYLLPISDDSTEQIKPSQIQDVRTLCGVPPTPSFGGRTTTSRSATFDIFPTAPETWQCSHMTTTLQVLQDGTWTDVKTIGNSDTVIIEEDLTPCSGYSYRLKVSNAHEAAFTHVEAIRTEEEGLGPITQPLSESIGPGTLNISWTPPEVSDTACEVTSYRIDYTLTAHKSCPEDEQPADVGVILSSDTLGMVTSLLLSGLEHYAEYNVSITPQVDVDSGSIPGETVSFMGSTTTGEPSGAPENVILQEVTQSHLAFSWSPPPCTSKNGVITGYSYVLEDHAGVVTNSGTVDVTSVKIGGLSQDTEYTFKVAAVNSGGTGPYSIPQTEATRTRHAVCGAKHPLRLGGKLTSLSGVTPPWGSGQPIFIVSRHSLFRSGRRAGHPFGPGGFIRIVRSASGPCEGSPEICPLTADTLPESLLPCPASESPIDSCEAAHPRFAYEREDVISFEPLTEGVKVTWRDWDLRKDKGVGPVTGYVLRYRRPGDPVIEIPKGLSLHHSLLDLTESTVYEFEVVAVKGDYKGTDQVSDAPLPVDYSPGDMGICRSGSLYYSSVHLTFPTTLPGRTASSSETCGEKSTDANQPRATRRCTEEGYWAPPDMQDCFTKEQLDDRIGIIINKEVTDDNVIEVAVELTDISTQPTNLGVKEIANISEVLVDIVDNGNTSPELTTSVIGVFNNLMHVETAELEKTVGEAGINLVQSLEKQISNVQRRTDNFTLIQENIGVAAVKLDPTITRSVTFVSSSSGDDGHIAGLSEENTKLYNADGEVIVDDITASVYLPPEVLQTTRGDNPTTLPTSFVIYNDARLFQTTQTIPHDDTSIRKAVSSQVISATIPEAPDGPLSLNSPIVTRFRVEDPIKDTEVVLNRACVSWDPPIDDQEGYWSEDGCDVNSGGLQTVCHCDRLGNFAVLSTMQEISCLPSAALSYADMSAVLVTGSVTESSVTFSWPEWNSETDTGNGTVQSYILRYSKYGESTEKTSIDAGLDLSATIEGLNSDTEYEFQISIVASCKGPGVPGAFSEPQIVQTKCTALTYKNLSAVLRVEEVNPSSVTLSWPEWDAETDSGNGTVQSYTIVYENLGEDPEERTLGVGLDLSVTIRRLDYDTEYRFRHLVNARCNGPYEPGLPSNPITVRTPCGALSYRNMLSVLNTEDVTSSSMTIAWPAWIESSDVGTGTVESYNLQYSKTGEEQVPRSVNAGLNLSAAIEGLDFDTDYDFQISITAECEGRREPAILSPPHTFRTQCGEPTRPQLELSYIPKSEPNRAIFHVQVPGEDGWGCPNITVYLQREDDGEWTDLEGIDGDLMRDNDNGFYLERDDLVPCSEVSYRIRLSNDHHTVYSDPVTVNAMGEFGPVENLLVAGTEVPGELFITWDAPSAVNECPITSYVIEYRLSQDPICQRRARVSVDSLNTTDTQVRLTGLQPYRSYEVDVYPAKVGYEGSVPERVTRVGRTRGDVPSGTVYPWVVFNATSIRELTFSWKGLPCEDHNSPHLSYLCELFLTNDEALPPPAPDSHITTSESCTFEGLTACGNYSFTVTPKSDFGLGVASPEVTARIPAKALAPITTVSATSLPNGDISLTWERDEASDLCPVVGYTISYMLQRRQACRICVDLRQPPLHTNEPSYVLQDLAAFATYKINISLQMEEDGSEGPLLKEKVITTMSKVPSEAPVARVDTSLSTNHSLTFKWSPISCTALNGIFKQYTFKSNVSKGEIGISNRRRRSRTLRNLKPCTAYDFQIRVVNTVGGGPFGSAVGVTSAGRPGHGFRMVSEITDGSVLLRWQRSRQNPCPVESYLIGARLINDLCVEGVPQDSQRVEVTLDNDVTSIRLEEILGEGHVPKAQSVYQITLRARNSMGDSGEDVLDVETSALVPSGSPVGVFPLDVTRNSVTIVWGEIPCNGRNGVIEGYEYALRKGEEAPQSKIVGENQVSLSSLQPDSVYFFKVRAKTSAGYGPYGEEAQFRTDE